MREIALELLMRIEKEGGFSHLLIANAIGRHPMDHRDETLMTEIVYGTTERKITLDYYLKDYIKQPKKMEDWVRMLLRMSAYQFIYLDKVPSFAVINESVNIAKKKGHRGTASFVNGVLRAMDRQGWKSLDDIKDPIQKLSLETSHPEWLVKRWQDQFGEQTAAAICRENVTRNPLAVRVNRQKTDRETVLDKLEAAGIEARPARVLEEAIMIEKGNVFKTGLLDEGLITIQDTSSMLAAKAVEAAPDMEVLDTCSAPGGKATFLGEIMENTGRIHAHDLHQNKIKLIKKHADRLGLTNIDAQAMDARKLQTIYEDESFDRVLVDAPCSGFGVIRSKPDIKYQKQEKDIFQLKTVQRAILDQVAPLVKIGGKLIYSTCTIEKEENEWQIKEFLERYPQYQIDDTFLEEMKPLKRGEISAYGYQLFPQSFHSDGFFITRLVKLSA